MDNNFQYYKFILTQIQSFSVIVFVITFVLIFLNSDSNIFPINIAVLLGSIFLFHYYPGYYDIAQVKAPTLLPLFTGFDFILHYIPVIYIIGYKVYENTKTNYLLCMTILISYILLFHSKIGNIYFEYDQYFS
jgi:hypothetical protein